MKSRREQQQTNKLFPVFLKLEQLSVLVVGGGNVGLEKLTAIFNQSPRARVRLVSIHISDTIRELAKNNSGLELRQRVFLPGDLDDRDIVIIAINDREESERIRAVARQKGKLVNVADKPEQCDFYMGSIVQKGDLKIAISTNGKSPTIAKRLRELFAELLPEEMDEVLDNMHQIRSGLAGDFAHKVRSLNELTRDLVARKEIPGGNG